MKGTTGRRKPTRMAWEALCFAALAVALLGGPRRAEAIDPTTLPEVGYHPGGIAYWDTPQFANAMYNAWGWMEFVPGGPWGNGVPIWNSPQFDANGCPQYVNPGTALRALVFGLHVRYGNRPAGWPDRAALAQGRVVLEWEGDADVRLHGGTFLASESTGPATGSLVDGRRVYRYDPPSHLEWLEVHDVNNTDPITDIKVWLPDPADPMNATLEDELFHPTFLDRIGDAEWGFLRMMNLMSTNANPEQDWSDRRPPTHLFMTGTLNPRPPTTGFGGNRETGAAIEHLVALCNATQKDLWVCVPHLATEDYVRRLARTIRFGSDGVNPYTSPQANPFYAPLDSNLRVFVEYSNEIWSGGNSFPQGNWAEEQAALLGISKPQFNGRRFAEIWRLFQEEFGGTSRLVRVAAVFTAADWYTQPFLEEIAAYGPTLTPPVEPDVIAVTTYFGNGIQDWAYDMAVRHAGTADQWFLTSATFDPGDGSARHVSVPASDPYWTGAVIGEQLRATLAEWRRRLLSGDAREGAGPDAVGVGGGFGQYLRDLAQSTFPTPVPIIAYEGGPSLYTDNIDWGPSEDDGITTFMEALNRHPDFRDVYEIHLNMAKSRGLWTHVMFTDIGAWGKYGQWGHLEHLGQDPATAVKYQFLLDWMSESATRRHIDNPLNNVPRFDTAHYLPVAVYGQPYSADILASGGDGGRTIEPVGEYFVPGLGYDALAGDPDRVRITGSPLDGGLSYLYLRVVDADGDPAWRTSSVRSVGGPNTILESNLEGTDPAMNVPWTPTYILANGLGYGGLDTGAGIVRQGGDDAIVWAQNMPADEGDSTLALAIADNEWVGFTVTPPTGHHLDLAGHEMRFTIRRMSYHAPRRYALFSSINGFDEADAILVTDREGGEEDLPYGLTLPDDPAWNDLTGPVEFRLVGFAGQYGGHETSLRAVRLDGEIVPEGGASVSDWLLLD